MLAALLPLALALAPSRQASAEAEPVVVPCGTGEPVAIELPRPEPGRTSARLVQVVGAERGTIYLHASGADAALRLELTGRTALRDDGAGGERAACIALDAGAGEEPLAEVSSARGGAVVLRAIAAPETDATLAEAEAARADLSRAHQALLGDRAGEARSILAALLARDVAGADRSAAVQRVLWDVAEFAQAALLDAESSAAASTRVLAFRERVWPADHVEIQTARVALGAALLELGDFDRASALLEEAHRVLERTLPADDLELQAARAYLASARKARGDLEGGRALEELVLDVRSRKLPPEHPEVLQARNNLAVTLARLDDLRARDLFEELVDVLSRTSPEDDPTLQAARGNLAATLVTAGELARAAELQRQVVEVWTRKLTPDHPELARARLNLTGTLRELGDLAGARALAEQVLDTFERTLPGGRRELWAARSNLALCLQEQGEVARAIALQRSVLEDMSAALPDEHPELQLARANLAAALQVQGDIEGARALKEKVLDVWSRTLPDDHPHVQSVRMNLAATLYELGDLEAARALSEQVLDVWSRTLPDDHPRLQMARANLATILRELGRPELARELQEQALEVFSRAFPDDHVELQSARTNLGITLLELGDAAAARDLFEQVLAVHSRIGTESPDLQPARLNLAMALVDLDEADEARSLADQALAALTADRPEGHPDLQQVRQSAIRVRIAQGDAPAARETALDLARGVRVRLRDAALVLSPREAEGAALASQRSISLVLGVADGAGVLEPTHALDADAFALVESARSIGVRSARAARVRAGESPSAEVAGLRRELAERSAAVARRAASEEGPAALREAVRAKEHAERELLRALSRAPAAGSLESGIDAAALARSLAPDEVAVGYWRYPRIAASASRPGHLPTVESLLAWVVRPSGDLARVELGALEEIEAAAWRWRESVLAPVDRGLSAQAQSGAREDERAAGETLRRLVLDPLGLDPAETRTLWVALDEPLGAVPLDALPADGGGLVGEELAIRVCTSLSERATGAARASEAAHTTEPRGLLLFGGIDYFDAPLPLDAPEPSASAGTGSEEAAAVAASATSRAGPKEPWERGFAPLPETDAEIGAIAALYGRAFAGAPLVQLEGRRASREALRERAPSSRWLHLATHGYFAPESVPSTADPLHLDRLGVPASLSTSEQVQGLSPLVLCGLALAGANRPPDALGHVEGVITAEEIAGLDLSACELAVLSACDTNVGIRRAGQGVASLQKALHMAGARSAITSLWKVRDEATRELMVDFYRRLWMLHEPEHQALWKAKMRLRDAKDERGQPRYATRDWAGWVLSSD